MFVIKVGLYKFLMAVLKLAAKLIPQNPPLIFSGENSSLQLAQFIAEQGYSRVLIVTDQVLNELGIPAPICRVLKAHDIEFEIFDQVTPDPSEHIVERGVALGKGKQCDAVLGIGGGSSLDAAKMIAVLMNNNKSVKQLAGMLKIRRTAKPLYLLPTTSGTGSEVTMAAVITDTESSTKSLIISPRMIAVATALDPVVMQGMPPKITADTGFDALTHAVEAYLSLHANEYTNRYALTAVKLIFRHLLTAYQQGDNLEARHALAQASCYAGLAFTKAGLGYVHAISHQLGAKYHLPHGMTNAVVLPHVLVFSRDKSKARLAQLAIEIGISADNRSQAELAAQFIERVKALQKQLNIVPSLAEIQTGDIEGLASAALKEAHYLYPVPKYMNHQECQQLIRQLMPDAG